MVAALGVNQKWLFTSVFALGVFLAALGGALAIAARGGEPHDGLAGHRRSAGRRRHRRTRQPARRLPRRRSSSRSSTLSASWSSRGSRSSSCFWSWRSCSCCGPGACSDAQKSPCARRAARRSCAGARCASRDRAFVLLALVAAALLPFVAGDYLVGVATEVLIFIALRGEPAFSRRRGRPRLLRPRRLFRSRLLWGGDRAEAVRPRHGGARSSPASCSASRARSLSAGSACACSGVYFAMLTLAFAQIAWSVAYQWTR